MPSDYVYQLATDGKKGGKGAIIRKKKRKDGAAQDPKFPMENTPVISALTGTLPVNVGGWKGEQQHQHHHQGPGPNGRGGHKNWKNWWKDNQGGGGHAGAGGVGGGGGRGYISLSNTMSLVS